jgi:hypothetical protein
MPDFTLVKYRKFCQFLKDQGYPFFTIKEYLELKAAGRIPARFAIIRHDVDRWLHNSVRMAKEEQKMGIRSTYYFRYPATFQPVIIQSVSSLGHEIGYHYKVVSKNNGDLNRAMEQFIAELSYFRSFVQVHTICMHGNPLSPYDNRTLWNTHHFEDFGVTGEAYLSLSDLQYFTDTGRTWAGNRTIYDVLPGVMSKSKLTCTDDLISWIRSTSPPHLYLTVHPERWAPDPLRYLASWSMDLMVNIGKVLLKAVRR